MSILQLSADDASQDTRGHGGVAHEQQSCTSNDIQKSTSNISWTHQAQPRDLLLLCTTPSRPLRRFNTLLIGFDLATTLLHRSHQPRIRLPWPLELARRRLAE